MKLTKLLAMLLALCMIICCFAACGGKDDDKDDDKDEKVEDKEKDEDEDEDDEKDKDEEKDNDKSDKDEDKSDKDEDKSDKDEEDVKKPSKAEGIEGEWEATSDFGALVAEMAQIELDAELELTWNFEFKEDGEYDLSLKLPSDKDWEKFVEAVLDYTIDTMMEQYEVDTPEELAEAVGYDSYDEFYEEGYDTYYDQFSGLLDGMETEESGEYEYEDGVIVFDGELEIEIDLDGDTFTVEDSDDENFQMVLVGVEFERQ